MAKTKKIWKNLNECVDVVEYPNTPKSFNDLRDAMWEIFREELPFAPGKSLEWEPNDGGFFVFTFPTNICFPDELGVDANETALMYYIDPKKGIEAEVKRVIDSIRKVTAWTHENVWNRKNHV